MLCCSAAHSAPHFFVSFIPSHLFALSLLYMRCCQNSAVISLSSSISPPPLLFLSLSLGLQGLHGKSARCTVPLSSNALDPKRFSNSVSVVFLSSVTQTTERYAILARSSLALSSSLSHSKSLFSSIPVFSYRPINQKHIISQFEIHFGDEICAVEHIPRG